MWADYTAKHVDLYNAKMFIAKNICEYLFEPEFEYKIGCLLCKDNGYCQMMNIKQFEDVDYSCDLCCVNISEWSWVYECGNDEHHYCVYCADQVVKLHDELNEILMNVLEGELISNCIEMITDYTVGVVRIIDNKIEEAVGGITTKTNNVRKRKLEKGHEPSRKKRRLKLYNNQ